MLFARTAKTCPPRAHHGRGPLLRLLLGIERLPHRALLAAVPLMAGPPRAPWPCPLAVVGGVSRHAAIGLVGVDQIIADFAVVHVAGVTPQARISLRSASMSMWFLEPSWLSRATSSSAHPRPFARVWPPSDPPAHLPVRCGGSPGGRCVQLVPGQSRHRRYALLGLIAPGEVVADAMKPNIHQLHLLKPTAKGPDCRSGTLSSVLTPRKPENESRFHI